MLTVINSAFGDGNPFCILFDIGMIVMQLIFCYATKKLALRLVPVYIAAVSVIVANAVFFGPFEFIFLTALFLAPLIASDLLFAWGIYAAGNYLSRRAEHKIIVRLIVSVAVLSLFIGVLIWNGTIVFDYSAKVVGENRVYWHGVEYVPASGEYREGKTIARTDDGWMINEVEGDKSHTYIVLRSFLDQYLLVRSDHIHE